MRKSWALAALLAAAPAGRAAAAPITLKTSDGWSLAAWYTPPKPGAVVVVLIHSASAKASSDEWRAFAKRLRALGLGTLSFDLRGYGKSLTGPYGRTNHHAFTDADWVNAVKDVDAAFAYLQGAGISEDHVAVAGSMVGANIAAMAAQRHAKIAWALLLSPNNDYHGLSVGMGGSQPTLLVAGENDTESQGICQGLQKIDPEREFYIGPDGRGVTLLEDKNLSQRVLDWVSETSDMED